MMLINSSSKGRTEMGLTPRTKRLLHLYEKYGHKNNQIMTEAEKQEAAEELRRAVSYEK